MRKCAAGVLLGLVLGEAGAITAGWFGGFRQPMPVVEQQQTAEAALLPREPIIPADMFD